MNVLEYAKINNLDVEKVLNLCKKLDINVDDIYDTLSNDDQILLDYELEEATKVNIVDSVAVGGSNGYANNSKNVDSNNNSVDIDYEMLYNGSLKLRNFVSDGTGSLSVLKNSFSGINVLPGINSNDLNVTYVNQCVNCSGNLMTKVDNIINILKKTDDDARLFFKMMEEKDLINKNISMSQDVENLDVVSYESMSSDGIPYKYDVIGEINDDTPVILLNHGGGGSYKPYKKWLENGELVNAVVITFERRNMYENISYKLMEEVSSELGIPIENCSTAGFSAGSTPCMRQMANLVAEHPEIKNPTVLLIDGYLAQTKSPLTDSELKALGDSGAVVFAVKQSGVKSDINLYEDWSNNYNINFVKTSDNHCKTVTEANDPHQGVFYDYFGQNLIGFQTGQGDFPIGSYTSGNEEVDCFTNTEFYAGKDKGWISFDIGGKSLKDVYEMLEIDDSSYVGAYDNN